MKLILLLFVMSTNSLLAQNRSIHLKLRDIQTDTIKKQVIFKYRLSNIAPKDSLGIAIRRANGQLIKLNQVYGDVGIALDDGRKKTIFWAPVAERQRFDEEIEVVFLVKKVDNQGLTRKQAIDYGRWTISVGLLGYTIKEGININSAVIGYNKNKNSIPPTASEKISLNDKMNTIQQRQEQFYIVGAVSVMSLLTNVAISLIQAKTKLHPSKVKVANFPYGVGVTYKL